MFREDVVYRCGDQEFYGFLCHNKGIKGKRPAVLVAHAWRGLDNYTREKAEQLARQGYVVFAADVYGIRSPVRNDEEAANRMVPLFLDRRLLQQRIKAGYDVLAQHSLVDPQRLGAIGFCFGGLTAIELFRSGAALRGVVSFHAVLGDKMGESTAETVAIASGIKGSLLVLHGHDDPLVSIDDLTKLQDEMTAAKVDWQVHIYGHTSHAFTNQDVHNPAAGLLYDEVADRRSWLAMTNFFNEAFSGMSSL